MVDAGLYIDGRRIESPTTIAETVAKLRATPGAMAWIGLFRPTEAQLRPVAEEFGLHEVAVEPSNLSQQLAVLRRAGLVTTRKERSTVYYSLTTGQIAELLAVSRSIMTSVLSGQAELLTTLRSDDRTSRGARVRRAAR